MRHVINYRVVDPFVRKGLLPIDTQLEFETKFEQNERREEDWLQRHFAVTEYHDVFMLEGSATNFSWNHWRAAAGCDHVIDKRLQAQLHGTCCWMRRNILLLESLIRALPARELLAMLGQEREWWLAAARSSESCDDESIARMSVVSEMGSVLLPGIEQRNRKSTTLCDRPYIVTLTLN